MFILSSDDLPGLLLRSITIDDLEYLRNWKNQNRRAFFFQKIISAEDQLRWYKAYLKRLDDYMFVVYNPSAIGCMGFRLSGGIVDVYNVIRGVPNLGRKGIMRDAMLLMCSYATYKYQCKIECKVIADNPAVVWYEKTGFIKKRWCGSHFELSLTSEFRKVSFRIEDYRVDLER